MAAASILHLNFRENLRIKFREAIGNDLLGEIENFILLHCNVTGGDCALIFTTGGDVHAIAASDVQDTGATGKGVRLELELPHLRARKLRNICGLGVTDISFSGPSTEQHVLIATRKGQLFAWGSNGYGQLGVPRETVPSSPLPLLISGPLERQVVVKVACGKGFSACVTAAGEVWTWGANYDGQIGNNGSTDGSSAATKVQHGLEHHRVVSVSCGEDFVIALTDQGRLWSWGANTNGQLGRNSRIVAFDSTPGEVLLCQDTAIKSVACGASHTLAVTSDGKLYAWGDNRSGQLGNGHLFQESATPLMVRFNNCTPRPLIHPCSLLAPSAPKRLSSVPFDRFSVAEVAAHPALRLSAAKTTIGEVYVWGFYGFLDGHGMVSVPMLASCTDLDLVFLSFAVVPITFQLTPMNPASSPDGRRPSIYSCLRKLFDDETTSDIKFVADGKAIHAHRVFLTTRSEHFRCMFAKGASWAETTTDSIKILVFSFPVYHAFLFYLYTETLTEGLAPTDLISLLDLAQSYCEDELRALCVVRIADTIKCESAPTLYLGSIRCAAKDVEDLCCGFMIDNMTDLISCGALNELEVGDMLAYFLKATEKKAFRV